MYEIESIKCQLSLIWESQYVLFPNSPKIVLWKQGVKSGSSEFQVRLPFHTSATQYVDRVSGGGGSTDVSAIVRAADSDQKTCHKL